MRALLRVPEFRRLAWTWATTNFADSTLLLTIAIWVKDLTGSNSAAGLVLAALALPALLAPVTGQLADRVSRRRLIVSADLVAAAVVLALFAVRGQDELWLVYVVTIAYSTLGFIVSAAQSGLLKDLLPDASLASANGMLTTIDQGLRLVTPLIGAGLYVFAGIEAVVVLTTVMFTVAAVGMTTLRVRESPPTPAASREGFIREATAGFRHLRRTPVLGRFTLAMAAAVGATGITNTTNFAAIEQGLAAGPELLGVFASIQGVGAIVGGLTAATSIKRIGERVTAAVGLTLLALGLLTTATTSIALVCAGNAAAGVGIPWALIAFVTMRQRLTPPTLQGRTAAASGMAMNLPQTAATVLAAVIILAVDYRIMITVTVAVVLCAAGTCLPRGRAASLAVPEAAPTTVDS